MLDLDFTDQGQKVLAVTLKELLVRHSSGHDEMVDIRDLKSRGRHARMGSSPIVRTICWSLVGALFFSCPLIVAWIIYMNEV